MFGSSFSTSLPSAAGSSSSSSASASSSSGKKNKSAGFAFGPSTTTTSTTTTTTTSSNVASSSSLPFAGFGGGGFGAPSEGGGGKRSATGNGGGGFGFGNSGSSSGGGSAPLKHKSSAPSTSDRAAAGSANGFGGFGASSSKPAGTTSVPPSMTSGGGASFGGATAFAAAAGAKRSAAGASSSSGGGMASSSLSYSSSFSNNNAMGNAMGAASASSGGLPFGGFSSGGLGMSPPKSNVGGGGKRGAGISFSGAASSAAAAASSTRTATATATSMATMASSTALVPATRSSAITATTRSPSTTSSNNNNNSSNSNNKFSVENSCISPDGRSFHTYARDASSGRHAIISEFAPFGDGSANSGGDDDGNVSSLTITTSLPSTVAESVDIDPVIGLICVDGGGNDDGSKHKRRRQQREDGYPEPMLSTLPWMCLYTRTSAFLLSIGYIRPEEDDDDGARIIGTILHALEPFEKQLLTSPRGSSVLRIRRAPAAGSAFHRRGSMALLMREGGGREEDDDDDNNDDASSGGGAAAAATGYVVVLYHGLPESLVGGSDHGAASSSSKRGGVDFGGRKNPTGEGAVTVPLRFDYQDLVRGAEDTIDAENEAYDSLSRDQSPSASSSSPTGTKSAVDFCFVGPVLSGNSGGGGGLSASSILVLCNDGSVYGASPLLFDGTVLPRSVVVGAISHLDAEIDASVAFLTSLRPSPVPTLEQEHVEARSRQCRAARRYLSDAFGIPEGMVAPLDEDGRVGKTRPMQGSFYVSASVVHSRSYSSSDGGRYSQALSWQPRLQGPLVMPPQKPTDSTSPLPRYQCIESFGGAAGGGIVDGFVVVQDCKSDNSQTKLSSPIHVEFGILPGEGAVILPRFEFESDADCRLIDELVRGTGMYVERSTIMDDKTNVEENADASGEARPNRALSLPPSGRDCAIVVDPLDDIMIHVMTRSRIVTLTTNAVAVTANCFKSQMGESRKRGDNCDITSIRTKVWSGLEVGSSDAALIGARVSGDVHLGHILLARVSTGSMEVVNITATQVLHETTAQMKAKSEQLESDDEALQILKKVQPLHELLQPLINKVCDGLSKMGKIVGGVTLPKDAGPENLAVFLDTQNTCEENVLVPMEEMSKVISARRELLQEMYEHQAAELVRLTALLDEFKQQYESNIKRVIELEANAVVLTERSSAVLTATRELRPQITNAEAGYFKDLKRLETGCNKWDGSVSALQKDATSSCDAMSAGAIENGEVRCLVDLAPKKIEVCHKLLRGEGQLLKQIEKKVKESSDAVDLLSKTIVSGRESADTTRLRFVGGDKENQRR